MVLLLEGAWQAAEGGGRPVDCAAGKYLAQGECGWLPHLTIGASGVWRGRASGTYGHLLLHPPALRRPRRCGAPWGPRLEGSWRAGPLNPQAASPLSCRALSSRARAGCAGGRGRGREGQGPRWGADGSPRPLPRSFTQAMLSQPQMESLGGPTGYRLGLALLGVGSVFVLSSFLALGFTGTFLGKIPEAGPRQVGSRAGQRRGGGGGGTRGARRLRDGGHSGHFPPTSHPKAGFRATA